MADAGSHAAAGGGIVALSGQRATEHIIGAGDFAAEFDSALARLLSALEEAGGAPSDLLQLRVYVTDMAAYLAARPELGAHRPATTVIEVGALLDGARVEVDGLASIRPAVAP